MHCILTRAECKLLAVTSKHEKRCPWLIGIVVPPLLGMDCREQDLTACEEAVKERESSCTARVGVVDEEKELRHLWVLQLLTPSYVTDNFDVFAQCFKTHPHPVYVPRLANFARLERERDRERDRERGLLTLPPIDTPAPASADA
jgi:hypothetical protein